MKIFGTTLSKSSAMLPAGGFLGRMLPFLACAGIAIALIDFGAPELEKTIVAVGMFSAGVLFSRVLPVWREAEPGEIEMLRTAFENGPLRIWIRFGRAVGWNKMLVIFVILCAALFAALYQFAPSGMLK